jgi:hypothetical protein
MFSKKIHGIILIFLASLLHNVHLFMQHIFSHKWPVVGKSDEFITLLYNVDFFEANKGLIVIGTFYFNGALIF